MFLLLRVTGIIKWYLNDLQCLPPPGGGARGRTEYKNYLLLYQPKPNAMNNNFYNKRLKNYARELRSKTVSIAEKRIWKELLSRK